MNELIDFLTSKEIIVVYIVAAVACFLCFIIYLIDRNYYKRKQKHNTRELNKLVEEVNGIIEKEEYETTQNEVYETPVLETIAPEVKETSKIVVAPATTEEPVIIENITKEDTEEISPIKVEDLVLSSMPDEPRKEVVEELQYTTVEPNRQQAQEELMRLTEELEKAEQEARNIDLTSYEEEQEENAIISLEELVRKSKEMYASNEFTQYADEGNEPISLDDLERRMNKVKENLELEETLETPVIVETLETEPVMITPVAEELKQTEQMVLDDFNSIKVESDPVVVKETVIEPARPAYQTVKKFERSPVISPIYGIERKETTEDIELENTANYDKLDEEIKKTNEFLMTLRELQKNLD